MKIDTSQINAIRHKDGPMMVLAGPGSGKTLVITRRVQYLIEQHHIPPSNILVITFTRAAAKQMRERFEKLTNGRKVPVTFGTFHAVYFTVLKYAYGYTAANIAKEEQRIQFIKEFVHRLRLEYDDENEFVTGILSEISLVKNTSVNLEHYYSANCAESVFRRIYDAYDNFLRQNHLLDFDDILIFCKELFEQRKDILRAWQQKYQYILIDEFQDINELQYDIVRMLALPKNNLFIVGDDDQSVYRFRGAKPEIMLHFEKNYPDTKKTVLGTNYRSGKEIVRCSSNLISHNKTRFPKKLTPASQQGIPIVCQEFPAQREENLYIIEEIKHLHRQGKDYRQMAVLFRTNIQPRYLSEQMLRAGIPFQTRDVMPNIYDHWIARDIFTYIDLALGDRSRTAFLKVMNRPKRYLSRESLPYEEVAFDVWEDYYKEQSWMVQRLEKFAMDLNVVAKMRPFSAVNYIRKGIAYEDYLHEYALERRLSPDDLTDILDELQENAKEFDTFGSWFSHIEKLREEFNSQRQNHMRSQVDAVTFSTLHSAKGLEYDVVFLADVNERVMPYKKAVLDADIEEERRLFYVGMTRARERLYLLFSRQIHNKEMEPSRFLAECGQFRKSPS